MCPGEREKDTDTWSGQLFAFIKARMNIFDSNIRLKHWPKEEGERKGLCCFADSRLFSFFLDFYEMRSLMGPAWLGLAWTYQLIKMYKIQSRRQISEYRTLQIRSDQFSLDRTNELVYLITLS